MEFIRVNDELVKVVITAEDMDAYDVSLEDLFARKEKAVDFLHEIVRQAQEAVNYSPDGPMTSLQIAPIEDQGLAIFLSEKQQFNLHHFLKNLQHKTGVDIPEGILSQVAQSSAMEQLEMFGKLMENAKKEAAKAKDTQSDELERMTKDGKVLVGKDGSRRMVSLERKIFAFDSLDALLRYGDIVELPQDIDSRLYKDDDHGTYYLVIERKEAAVESLAGVYLSAYEYGHFVSEREEHAMFIAEHCDLLIGEKAIQKMKEMKHA